ncbi:MAG: iron chelate uptake ABC transporter family permease subunit [Chloroflexi bacterium]|nr:iron chelate uptake ABC transporter family permease subunit [Chloroflexota bacterium]
MRRAVPPLMLALLLLLAGLSLFVGVRTMTLDGLLANRDDQLLVLLVSRAPRLIAIITAGMGLSVAGLIMQRLVRNRFVSPSTAGTTESASLGLLVALLLFGSASVVQKMLISFAFALIGTYIFMRILDRIQFTDVVIAPLIGIAIGGVIGSVTTFIALRFDLLQSLGRWMAGDFSGVLRGRYEMLYVAVPATLLAYAFADRFTLAGIGEDVATNLGLNYRQVVTLGLGLISLVTAAVVITVGVIPFVGLIVPNVVSLMMGDNLKKTLPATAFLGVLLILVCDVIGRLVRYPYEVPIGVISGILGAAVFLMLLLRRSANAPQS